MENMTEYQKNLVRMWDSLRIENKGANNCSPILCKQCPFNEVVCISDGYTGDNYTSTFFNAEKAIEIVTQWAKEHPLVTYEQKYEEVFGVKPISDSDEYVCPSFLGLKPCKYGGGNGSPCAKCAKDFWQSEYKEPKKEGE